MAKSRIHNISGSPIGMPSPYVGILPAGHVAIVDGAPNTVIANLGGAENVADVFDVSPALDSESVTFHNG